jgi:SAM-dependent methyltransferase
MCWFADETFWSSSYPFMFPPESFNRAGVEVSQIIELTGCNEGRVLDLACGPGRHAIPFAKRGFTVTGVDRTQFLLQKAQEYGAEHAVEIEWVEADMQDFQRPRTYDLAVSLFTSFGFFEDPAENARGLTNVWTSLRSRGSFVIDVAGKEVIARKFQPVAVSEVAGYGLVVQRRRVIEDWGRIAVEWTHVRDGVARSMPVVVWVYSGQELKQMLLNAGFSTVALFGGLDGSAYGPEAKRLVAVARRA